MQRTNFTPRRCAATCWLSSLLPMVLAGCAGVPPFELPAVVHGEIARPRFSGWLRNICGDQELMQERLEHATCLPHGGEIFRARLRWPRNEAGERLARQWVVGYPGHALAIHYRLRGWLVLQPAPEHFRQATGIAYLVTGVDNYQPATRCLVEQGWAHTDHRLCPDPDFHRERAGECVPVAEFLRHHNERR